MSCRRVTGRSVKLLLAFASTVIPGLNLLEIHDQDFYSLLDMYVFQNGASSANWSCLHLGTDRVENISFIIALFCCSHGNVLVCGFYT
jgi:hypothetical protein